MKGLPYLHKKLTPALLKKAEKELGETEEVKVKTLTELKNLIKDEPDFHPMTEDWFLLRFLRARKFKVEQAFKTLKNYYKFRGRKSNLFRKPSEVMHVLEEGHLCFVEYNNVLICIFRIGQYDIEKFPVDDVLALAAVLFEICLMSESTQICGYKIIDDFSDLTFSQVKYYASPSLFYDIVSGLQDCFPARLKAFDIVNESFYCGILIKIFKMFMSEKLKRRINIHGSNLSELHKNIPPEILPEEFGGSQGPISKFVPALKEEFIFYEDHFVKMSKYGYKGKTLEKLRNS